MKEYERKEKRSNIIVYEDISKDDICLNKYMIVRR